MYADLVKDKKFLSRIVKSWFGIELDNFPEKIVITPLPFTSAFGHKFLEILDENKIKYEFIDQKAWFLRNIQRNLIVEDYLFAYMEMGNTFATDMAIVLRNIDNLREIIFVGAVAGTKEFMNVGDILLVNKAYNWDFSQEIDLEEDIKDFEKILEESKIYEGPVVSVPNVFEYETKEYFGKIKDKVYGLDLEIFYMAKILKEYNKKFIPIARVTDIPIKNVLFFTREYEEKYEKEKELARKTIFLSVLKYLGLNLKKY